MGAKLRVYLTGPDGQPQGRDFDASKVDIAADGSLSISKIENLGARPNLAAGGQREEQYRVTLLAIVGPDGRLRAETVQIAEALTLAVAADIPNGETRP